MHPRRTQKLSPTRYHQPEAVSSSRPLSSNETHDVKPHDPTPAAQLRAPLLSRHLASIDNQQHQQQQHSLYSRPTSSSGSFPSHSLRRTPRFDQRDSAAPLRPRSASSASATARPQQPAVRFADDNETPLGTASQKRASSTSRLDDWRRAEPHPAVRLSKRTQAAVLYALEEALRGPISFTSDVDEENASMSELFAGGPAARNGGARGISGPVPVPQAPASGVRTPTDIMRQRQAREAAREQRKRDEAADQAEADRQQRFQEEERRRSAERRAQAAGMTGQRDSGYRSQGMSSAGGRTPGQADYISPDMSPAPPPLPSQPAAAQTYPRRHVSGGSQHQAQDLSGTSERPAVGRVRGPTVSQDQPRAVPQQQAQPLPQTSSARAPPPAQPAPKQASAQADSGAAYPGDSNPPRGDAATAGSASFPHAFERWETLSSHWEGLTSYWIRRMEQNNEQIRRDPIAQQMSRQITDLSAAGANLFHAVVELQRLRASSERKFQRWFFETRAEQERARETQSTLQAALETERAGRQEDVRARQEDTRSRQLSMDADRRINEMKRELQISKDEARRAWEELGRREQLERDRIFSLREGHGIIIGDIQVLPQGLVSRGGSLQRGSTHETGAYSAPATSAGIPATAREAEYEQGPSPTETDPFSRGGPPLQPLPAQTSQHGQVHQAEEAARGGEAFEELPPQSRLPKSVSPASASRPLSRGGLGSSTTPTQVPPNLSTDPAQFYRQGANTYLDSADPHPQSFSQQQQPFLQRPTTAGGRVSEEESDDGGYALDDQGNVLRDARGMPIPFHSAYSKTRRGSQGQGRPGPVPIRDVPSQSRAPVTSAGRSRRQNSDDELDVAEDAERERIRAAAYGRSDSSRQVPTHATTTSGGGGGGGSGALPADYDREDWGDDDDFLPEADPLDDPLEARQLADSDRLRTHAELENERILHEEQLARQHGHALGDDELEVIEDDWDPSEQSTGVAGAPRHHHPTRLSDVLEEDELSRASRQSRGSF